MHSASTPSAPYQSSMPSFRLGPPSQAKTSLTTQIAPFQTRMHQCSPSVTPHAKTSSSNPFQASRSIFIHSYTRQHSSTPTTPHQSDSTTQNPGAHHNSNNNNLNPRQKKTRVVTLETLKASKNASKYMEAIRHGGSQSSVHGLRKWKEHKFIFPLLDECHLFCVFIVIGLAMEQCPLFYRKWW